MTLMTIDRLRPLPGPVSPTWRWMRHALGATASETREAIGCPPIIPDAALKSSGTPSTTITSRSTLLSCWEVLL
jgi:hypothetical protein